MSVLTAVKQHLERVLPRLEAGERRFREEAVLRMESAGLPKRGTETWKYTSIAPLDMMNWSVRGANKTELPAEKRRWLDSLRGEFDVAVFVNGEYAPDLSQLSKEIQISAAPLVASGWKGEDGFADASLAVARPGLSFRVGSRVRAARPLLLLKYQDAHEGWISTFNQLALEPGAELSVAEVWIGGEAPYLRTDLTAVTLAEGARLTWLRQQTESPSAFHFSETRVSLAAQSALHFTQLNRGSHWLRGQMFVDLLGSGAEAFVHGLTFGKERQHLDQRVVVSHLAAESSSSQLFKGVYADSAKGVLNGKIYIAPNAQKVASRQMNHNLLIGPNAEANTKPELEIYADDVKANHGATVGRLDEDKIFYLESRGIPKATAEQLLSDAFVADVLMKIPDERLRRLAGESHVS